MSTTVDERVVIMEFDNSDFEKNVETSRRTLKNFKRELNFADSADSFNDLEKNANRVKLKGLTDAFDGVTVKVNAWSVAANTAIAKIVSAAIDGGARIVKALSFDQIASGWSKYEAITTSTQTMMAAVKQDAEGNTDEVSRMKYVEKFMDRLTWMTDETSYNLTSMTDTLGKFIAAGVDIDQAASAIQGVATWAALAGQNASTATRAMEQLAQALGSGTVTAQDWSSIETANMATEEAKAIFLEAAVAEGKLIKKDGKYYALKNKEGEVINGQLKAYINGIEDAEGATYDLSNAVEVTTANFRTTLSEKWFSVDVLNTGLKEYGAFADRLGVLLTENKDLQSVLTKEWVKYVDQYDNATSEIEKKNVISELAKTLSIEPDDEEGMRTVERYLKDLSGDYVDYAKELERINNLKTDSTDADEINAIAAEKAAAKEKLLKEFMEETGLEAEEAEKLLNSLSTTTMDLGRKAFRAAQETKTFTEVLDATKEAVATKWMRIFQNLFGNYLEAKELWSDMSEQFYNIFVEPLNSVLELVGKIKNSNGISAIFGISGDDETKVKSVYELLMSTYDTLFGWHEDSALGTAIIELYNALHGTELEEFSDIIDEIGEKAATALQTFRQWFENIVNDDDGKRFNAVKNYIKTFISGLTIIKTTVGYIKQILSPIVSFIGGLADRLFNAVNSSDSLVTKFSKFYSQSELINSAVELISDSLSKISKFVLGIFDIFATDDAAENVEEIGESVSKTTDFVESFKNALKSVSDFFKKKFGDDKNTKFFENIDKIITSIENGIDALVTEIKQIKVADTIVAFIDMVFAALKEMVEFANLILPMMTKVFEKTTKFIQSLITASTIDKINTLCKKLHRLFRVLFQTLTGYYGSDFFGLLEKLLKDIETPLTTVAYLIYRFTELIGDTLTAVNSFLAEKSLKDRGTELFDWLKNTLQTGLDTFNDVIWPKIKEAFTRVKEITTKYAPLIVALSPILVSVLGVMILLIQIQKIAITVRDALYSISDFTGLYARGEAKKYAAWGKIILSFAALVAAVGWVISLIAQMNVMEFSRVKMILSEMGKIVLYIMGGLLLAEAFANGMDLLRSWKNKDSYQMVITFQSIANVIFALVIALGAIVYMIKETSYNEVQDALLLLCEMLLGVTLMIGGLVVLGGVARMFAGTGNVVLPTISSVLLIVMAMAAAVYGIYKLREGVGRSFDKCIEYVKDLLNAIGVVILGMAAMSLISNNKKIASMALLLSAVALVFAAIGGLIVVISQVPEDQLLTVIGIVAAIGLFAEVLTLILAVISLIPTGNRMNKLGQTLAGLSLVMLSIATSIAIIAGVVYLIKEYIGTFGAAYYFKLLTKLFCEIGLVTAVMIAATAIAKEDRIISVGYILMSIATCIAIFVGLAFLVEKLTDASASFHLFGVMVLLLASAAAGLIAVSRIARPDALTKANKLIWSITLTITLLVGVALILTYVPNLNEGMIRLGIIVGMVAILVSLVTIMVGLSGSSNAHTIGNAAAVIRSIGFTIAILAGLVWFLSSFVTDSSAAIKTLWQLVAMIFAITAMAGGLALISKVSGIKAGSIIGILFAVAGVITILAGVVYVLTLMGDNINTAVTVLGEIIKMFALLSAILVLLAIFSGAGLNLGGALLLMYGLLGVFLGLSVALILVSVALAQLNKVTREATDENLFYKFGESLVNLIQGILDGMTNLMPTIVEFLETALSSFIDLILDGILILLDKISEKGIEIADKVLSIIVDILTVLNEHAEELSKQAVLLATNVTLGMIKGLTENLPELLDAGVKFIIAFIGGLGSALEGNAEELWEAVRKLIRGILNVFLTLLGIDEGKRNKILDKAEEIMKSIGPTIAAKTTAVIQAVKTFCTNVWNTLKEKLINLPTKIKEKLNEAWESVKKKFTEWKDNFKENGKNIIMGLVNGVGEKVTALKEAFVNVGETAVKKFKEFFGIKSPSRLMAENGRYIDEGIIVGLESYSGKVADASENVGGGIVDAFSEAIATAANLVENGIDSEPTIRPVMDLSNIQNGMSQVGSLFDQSYSVDATGSYARSAAGYNRGASSDISGESNTTVTNNQDINNIFNISGEDPKAIAEEVSRILQQQIGRRNSVWA